MKNKDTNKRIFLTLLVLGIIFGLYIYKLRSVAVYEDKIFEYRCINVNPKLNYFYDLMYKNAAKIKENPKIYSSSEEGLKFSEDMMIGTLEYVKEETKWLEIQKKHMDSLDFKLFTPWYLKKSLNYQYKMYNDYLNESNLILKMNSGEIEIQEGKDQNKKLKEIRYQDIKLYYDFSIKLSEIKDWRKKIITLHLPSGCNEENTFIPDTQYP